MLLWLLARPGARAQAPVWQSALLVSQGSGNYSSVQGTAADASGNVYLVGSFSGTVRFGSTTLTSVAGSNDVFVAKWNSAGAGFVWAQQAGGSDNDLATAVAVQGSSIYVVGAYHSYAMSFGPSITLANAGVGLSSRDAFVAKLTDAGSTGRFVWAQAAGGTGEEYATAVAVSGSAVYMAGRFDSGPAAFGSLAVSTAGRSDVFVAKMADAGSSGSFTWVQRAGGAVDESPSALAVSGASVYIAGFFSGYSADFGSTTLRNYTNSNAYDAFVAKLTDAGPTGAFVWAQRAGGLYNEVATALAVSGPNVYMVGRLESPAVSFGPFTLTNTSTGIYEADAFVAKLIDAGSTSSFAWVQGSSGAGTETAYAAAVAGNNVYVVGSFRGGTATFGPQAIATAPGNGTYTGDVFVAKLTDAGASGGFVWAQSAGGTGNDIGYTVAIAGPSIFVGGSVVPAAGFGSVLLAATPANESGFLASLTDATGLAAGTAQGLAHLDLFPNPARGTAFVQLPPVPGATRSVVTVRDAVGRVVRAASVPLPAAGLRYPLALGGLPAGVYAVQVTAGAYAATRRLVVE